jgi:hypothetical protein
MLLKAIVGASLKPSSISALARSTPIALWMSNRCIENLDGKIFIVPLKGITSKLGPIVGDDSV